MRLSLLKRAIVCCVWVGLLASGSARGAGAQQAAKHAITFDDLLAMHRVAEAELSPDGKWVAYTVATPDMEANRNATTLWMAPVAGGDAIQLTRTGKDSSPKWSPDEKMIAFLSARSGDSQVYLLSMDGGEAHAITKLSTGADIVKWSPDGKTISFTSGVYPECKDDECNKKRNDEKEKNKVKAHVAEHLLYRHWTHWNEGTRSHLFVQASDGSGEAKDLTAGPDYDVPPDQRGEESDINFSPDSKEICFTAVTDKVEATSTNGDLFVVAVSGGEPKRITTQPGFDGNPAYSPDGKYVAYHAQLTAGYEADRWRVMLYDRATGKNENLSEGFDRSAANLAWSPDSRTIYFLSENETRQPVYAMAPRVGATPKKIVDGFNAAMSVSEDGKTLLLTRTSLIQPAELFVAASDGSGLKQVTHANDPLLAKLEMNAPETFWFDGAEGTKVQAMLIRPPHFDASKKYPLLVLLHGGPQTMWTNAWGYRWNAQVFSAAGYATLMINRRGSTGYGQRVQDEIKNDWGGKAYVDVMKGVDAALGKFSFLDGTKMAAGGGADRVHSRAWGEL